MGMSINLEKSCIILNHCSSSKEDSLLNIIPAQSKPLSDGFKYLGFCLKPDCYKKEDWNWLIRKVETRILVWVNCLLSRGGHLVLLKSILESILVYWNSIATIPKGVLDKIRRLCFRFLWVGQKFPGGIHLASWKALSLPKELGGWGLKYIRLFTKSLAGHNMWHLSMGNSLWIRVMNSKYFPNLFVTDWFRTPVKSSKGSIVWKVLVEAFPLVGSWTMWKVGNGKKVHVGEDPWIGAGDKFHLSPLLILALKEKNVCSLFYASIGAPHLRGHLGWKDAYMLDLPEELQDEWESYVKLLCENFIILDEETKDSLCWSRNPKSGSYIVKLGYRSWVEEHFHDPIKWWWKPLWKFKSPLK
jgi:hypothetical protein